MIMREREIEKFIMGNREILRHDLFWKRSKAFCALVRKRYRVIWAHLLTNLCLRAWPRHKILRSIESMRNGYNPNRIDLHLP